MSAKRSHKPQLAYSPNVNSPGKRAKTATSSGSTVNDPTIFDPMGYGEHAIDPRIPPDINLTLPAIFGLFWNDTIITKLVPATTAYVRQKKVSPQHWPHPTTVSEFRRFLEITILMGLARLGKIGRYQSHSIVSARRSMSFNRYCQIKRFIHISMPDDTVSLCRGSWWKKLEPLSSHLRQQSQLLGLPGTHLSVDEMMVPFTGQSFHTVRILSKPLLVGYKVIALCSSGYTIDWMHTSLTESFAGLERKPELSRTSLAVLQLCRTLDTKNYSFIVYTDNGFSTIPLFRALREKGIGACSTTRVNRVDYPSALENNSLLEWNSIYGYAVGLPSN